MAGTLITSTIQGTTLTDGTNSTSTTNCIQGSAKAWVNFNGSGGAIRNSFNVSSITVITTGQYTVNFTTAMPNTNYVPLCGAEWAGGQNIGTDTLTTTSVNVDTRSLSTYIDYARVDVVVFSS
jgi:hypothetical protein